ncbi:variant erythrocyte surface antigen-1 family protein [Babesia caballi]|uniref:Variant erythrocyte surface antigen-1 family protein n=1 Tax=Babesia caballi TaxID=5871 RepID=A0AAV4LW27_BABCB|nr:variant erythrocyte surface antigen-1 family protein [Babesia caballi]
MGVGQKQKLTDPPTNLKEAIDWFLRVGGKDTGNQNRDKSAALKNAVYELEGHQALKSALGNGNFEGLFRKVAEALQGFIGYDNSGNHELKDKGIGRKGPPRYTASYSKEAQCNGDNQAYAHIFLGSMPVLYFGLTYTYWKCSTVHIYGGWGTETLHGGGQSPLYLFMVNMGFETNELQNMKGEEVAKRLTSDHIYGFEELKKAQSSSPYSDFLENVKQYGEEKLTSLPVDCSLYVLYNASTAYLTSKFKNDQRTTDPFDKIKATLESVKSSCSRTDPDLSEQISKFLQDIGALPTAAAVEYTNDPSSPAGPVAGTLTTFGLGGGAAAAYLFNFGGAKTYSTIRLSRPLLDCPSNLKEAIDWILRVTGKDGAGQSGTSQLAGAITQLLDGVQSYLPELQSKIVAIKGALSTSGSNGIIGALGEGLNKFKEGIEKTKIPSAYNSSSQWTTVFNGNTGASGSSALPEDGAKIFLGCLPMIFSALSYLYWKSKQPVNQGGWKTMPFNFQNNPLGYFMLSNGFTPKQLTGDIVKNVLSTVFGKLQDFSDGLTKAKKSAEERAQKEDAAKITLKIGKSHTPGQQGTGVDSDKNPTYPEFLSKLHDNGKKKSDNIPSNATENSLTILFHISYLYFRGRHTLQSNAPEFKPRPPSTIREMLYFLAALPFSHSYGALSSYITEHFRKLVNNSAVSDDYELMIPVADSSSPNTNNTLSAADLKDYLTNTCLYCPTILGRFQGNSADSKDEPWLHSLFSNTQFSLGYPSGAPLLNSLANYVYALQFQLGFLYQQCSLGSMRGCCWRQCKYGSTINAQISNTSVQSHICTTNSHNSGSTCGTSNPSPLQAFLTDNLKGFSLPPRADPGSLNHLENHPPGSMCHVKMGFQSTDLRRSGSGHYIYYTLEHFCGFSNDPLHQLSEKLSCLTKRTPRTLGDLFGFIWHLNGQLFRDKRPTLAKIVGKFGTAFGLGNGLEQTFNNDRYSALTTIWNKIFELKSQLPPSGSPAATGLSRALESMAPSIPFLYQLFMMPDSESVPGKLYDLRGSGHNGSHSNDLLSLRNTVCNGANCGGYLYPLTHSEGATYTPSHASEYLSWAFSTSLQI